MNRPTLLLGSLVLVASSMAMAQAGPRSTTSGNASVEIVAQDLTLSPQLVLAFGIVKGGSVPGTVIVRPQGIRAPGGGAELVGSGPCQTVYCEDETNPSNSNSASYWGPGRFEVIGAPGSSYRITAAPSAPAFWRTPANGRVPELLSVNFTFLAASTGSASGILDANGRDIIRVGGTLQVPAGIKAASYRVSVPIMVEYN